MLEMALDEQAEVAKLREKLRLCQLELASARREQEKLGETVASEGRAARRLRELSSRLNKRLERGESVSGVRGWVKRHQLSTMPRSEEAASLAVLRSSKLMDGTWYLMRYPEVASTGLSPALHYLRTGAAEQKNPGPSFSTRKYLAQNPDLPKGENPLVHFHATHTGTTS